MIDKTIFQLMLDKCNDATINTQGIKFKGNFVFVRVNDNQQMLEASEYNPYDSKLNDFVPCAEIISQETSFVEDNNRSGWVKRYAFTFDIRDKDKTLTALQQVRDYFRENSEQTITDTVDTVDTEYTMNVKVSRPSFMGNQADAGTIYSTYYMDFFADMIETGAFANGVVHTMALRGETKVACGEDTITISQATTVNPSNKLTASANTENRPVSRAMSFDFFLNYNGSDLHKEILSILDGNGDREQRFDYRKVFGTVTRDYDIIITGGSVVYKKGIVLQLRFKAVEYS